MVAIVQATVQGHLATGDAAATKAGKGKALEDLICYVFAQVPGVSITHRNDKNAFETEEIDVALWNDQIQDGLFFLPNVILVECKNWSKPIGSIEVAWFDTKLRNRGLPFGLLIARNGITGSQEELTAAHGTIAAALQQGRRLVVLTTQELLALGDSDELIKLIKVKLCDLAVKGTMA